MSRRLPAWLRYWFPKRRPPRPPRGLRGPYDPRQLQPEDRVLMLALRARTPQHGRRVVERSGRRAFELALERVKTPRKWRYKARMLIWRLLGYSRTKTPQDSRLPRLRPNPRVKLDTEEEW